MMEPKNADLESIRQVLDGDAAAFEDIVLRHQDKVLRLCHSLVGPAGAEDAAQEVFIKVYGSLAQFKGESAFSTWLYRVTSNHCLNILAKRKRERTESLDALIEARGDKNPALSGERSFPALLESKEAVEGALARLSPEERTALTLRELEGLTYKEIAEALNISLDLVKVRLFRARKSFTEILRTRV